MDTRQTLADIAVREFECDPAKLAEGTPISELGIDSLAFIEFIFRIEEVFGVRIDDTQAEQLKTITQMADLVDELRAAAVA